MQNSEQKYEAFYFMISVIFSQGPDICLGVITWWSPLMWSAALDPSIVFISVLQCIVIGQGVPIFRHTRGGLKISCLFALSQKPLNIFQKFFFKVFPTNIYTLLPSSWELCIPSATHEVDLLLGSWFTAKIKAALVSYLFPASFFTALETNKSVYWIR